MPEQNDHDILTTLVERITNMKKGQDDFHIDVNKKLDDLQQNYSDRISSLERSKTDVIDFKALEIRTDILEKWQSKVLGIAIGVSSLSGLATAILFKYIIK